MPLSRLLTPAGSAALRDPAWPARRAAAVAVLLVTALLLHATEFAPWVLWQPRSLAATGSFLAGFLPPALDAGFLRDVAQDTARTVAIATTGLLLAGLIAVPAGLLTCRVLSISALDGRMAPGAAAVRAVLRGLLAVLRSVPELVWALLFVRVVGLGPAAGVLAIALTYGGMLGKVYAEILESGGGQASQALLRQGCGRLQAFFYGALPQNAAELCSYTVYRWECAIRSSVVLGFVGAGGLGQRLDSALKMFAGGEVATLLLVFLALVAAADAISAALRRALDGPPPGGPPARGLRLLAPLRRAAGPCGLALLVGLALASVGSLDLRLREFWGAAAWTSLGRFLAEFMPPAHAPAFLAQVLAGAWQTLAMSALGTAGAAVAALGLAIPAAGRGAARRPARLLLNALRSVPELVWAGLLLISAGLGPFAGTLALAAHTTGVLGRLFAEAFENLPPGPGDALRAQGVGPLRVALYAWVPQGLPQLLSYTLYRWENNIRAAAVLGVVGAGGLGQLLSFHLGLFHMEKAATVLIAMLLLVTAVDAASLRLRRLLES